MSQADAPEGGTYRLFSVAQGSARQARFGVWGPPGSNGPDEKWPLVLTESYDEYQLDRQTAQQDRLFAVLPTDATRITIFDVLAEAEELDLTWAMQCEQIRAEMIESDELSNPEEIARFDANTEAGPRFR